MLERASLFLLGGGAYAALELAWRGTTHWTMFLTGGVCLCLLQALADRPLPLGPAAAVGAAASAGWSWPSAQSAAACCTPPSGITPTSGAIWPGWSAPNTPPTGFCCAGGSFLCCAVLKVPFITLKNPPPGIKVQIIVLPVWYNKSMESKTGHRKAVSTMTQQFRYVGGHIEVFAENGEFLFSADTMQEAWDELSA